MPKLSLLLATGAVTASLATTSLAQDAPAGTDADAAYADLLWEVMVEARLAGDDMLHAFPYDGVAPHGMMLETFYTSVLMRFWATQIRTLPRSLSCSNAKRDTTTRTAIGFGSSTSPTEVSTRTQPVCA